jgi:hypothetical protein
LDISLSSTLLRLADVVSLLGGKLSIAVTGNTSNSALDGASHAIGNTTGEVIDLALSFLCLARGILLLAFLFQ